jgi:molecular chaperone GrpE
MPDRASEQEVMPPAGAAAPPADRDDGGDAVARAAASTSRDPGRSWGAEAAPPPARDAAVDEAPPGGRDAAGNEAPAAGGEAVGEPSTAAAGRADGQPADADGDAVAEGEPVDEATELREQAGRYLDMAQRTQADFDNYRKRMARDVRAAEARGIGKLARELLPALDNLERALAAVDAAEPEHHLTEGIRLVTAELSAALGRTGIEAYSPKGEPFDPSQHEAVAQQPVEGAEQGTVVQVLQAGYRLNDAILRPARVIVAG